MKYEMKLQHDNVRHLKNVLESSDFAISHTNVVQVCSGLDCTTHCTLMHDQSGCLQILLRLYGR